MKNALTPLQLIQWAVPLLRQNHVYHPRHSAFSLVAFALSVDTLKLHLHFDRPLKTAEVGKIKKLIARRMNHEPLEYILEEIYFFGLPFKVSPAVLRPRIETGQLVELALEALAPLPQEKRLVLDLGTGCGNLALAVAKYIPCRVWALDISAQALAVAKTNARRLKVVSSLQWRQGDWFQALTKRDPAQFQVILCNPPYIAQLDEEFLNTEIQGYEPPVALYGGKTGLDPYRAVAQGMAQRLAPGGIGLMELEPNRAKEASDLFKGQGLKRSFAKDDAGVNRVLVLEKK